MAQGVRKAVFPVAGLGTRFLPATKAVPKELLPVVDRPLIQYAVEEAIEAGADTLIFVVSPGKQSILDHFRPDATLEEVLGKGGKHDLLERVQAILPAHVTAQVAIQEQALGLGHAVRCARQLVSRDEYFAVILPDDMVRNPGCGALEQLVDVHQATGANVIGVERIAAQLSASYGIAEIEETGDGHQRVLSLVEKPAPEDAPSDLGIVGRYVLSGEIFDILGGTGEGAGGEIQLTDGIVKLMETQEVYAHVLQGTRYDCGSRLGMIKANIDYALDQERLRPELLTHLRQILDGAD